MGEDVFHATIAGGAIDTGHGAPASPDAVLTLDPGTLLALIHGEISVAEALETGVLALDGDRAAVERLVGLFPLPEPAPLPFVNGAATRS
jgi:putative sterol carrier protein